MLVDRSTAEAIQLRLEYNPAPPFNAGSPDTAPPEVLALMKERIAPFASAPQRSRSRRAAARLSVTSDGSPSQEHRKKKAAWLPRRPFLSHGGPTFTGDFRTSAPGAYLPAVS